MSTKRRTVAPFSALLLVLALFLPACVSLPRSTAPSPGAAWNPPPAAEKKTITLPEPDIPRDLASSRQAWTLADILDIGLRNNTATRLAWQQARAAAASLGMAKSLFFPRLSFDLVGSKAMGSAIGGRFTFDYSELFPEFLLTFTVFDFGLSAGLEAARQALYAANFAQNAALQNAILAIEQDYYIYLASKALLAVQETALEEARANLDAAETRQRAGVATIADVLQARTALSTAKLDLVSTQGQVRTQKGALATAMGLPADTPFEIVDALPETLPLESVAGEVERFIAAAKAERPDLAAARAQALEARAKVRFARSDGLPTISLSANAGRTYYNIGSASNTYSVSVVLDIPLFKGFQVHYEVLQAKAQAEAAATEMQQLEQAVVLQVWTSYSNLDTSKQQVATAVDLVASASKSYDVTFTGYKRGVNSILDLLSSENSLAGGRAQLIQAKTNWLLSLVQFQHDTGRLKASAPKSPAAVQGERIP
jgi:outer membrane protein